MVNGHLLGEPLPQSIAIVRSLPGLGELLCAVPAWRSLRAALPEAQITLIGLPSARTFIERFSKYLDDLVEFPGYPGIPEVPTPIEKLPAFFASVQQQRFDLALQMHGNGIVSNPFTVLLGASFNAGFYLPGQYCPDAERFLPYPAQEPEVWCHLRLMEFLGVPLLGADLEFPLQEEDFSSLQAIEEVRNLQTGEYVCVHPGASVLERRWSPENFAVVADALAARGLQVILTGTAAEADVTQAVLSLMRFPAFNLAGRTSLGAIAERIAYLYQNPESRGRLSRQAIQRANQLFTWQQVTSAVAALYEKVSRGGFNQDVGGMADLLINPPVQESFSSHLTLIDQSFDAALEALERLRRVLVPAIVQAAQAIFNCLSSGGKVLVCGNGGSAADAQHFAGELVGRFRVANQRGLPVVALTADIAFLTAWANDVGFEYIFSRQVETFASPGDLLLGISTSGRSRNVIEAFKTARSHHISCVALLGGDGGELLAQADIAVVVPATDTQRIQEVQIFVLHMLCELVEKQIVSSSNQLSPPVQESEILDSNSWILTSADN